MEITITGSGTSQGVPVIGCDCEVCKSSNPKDNRLRSSIHIYYKNQSIVIDTGPDFRQQMLRADCKKLDAIVFTHEHADHTSGIDDTRPYFFRQGKIPIYLHERVLNSLKERFAYIFDPTKKYPGAPDFDVNLINKDSKFQIKDLTIIPVESMHMKLPVLGFRINNFAYLTDVKTIHKEELEKLKLLA